MPEWQAAAATLAVTVAAHLCGVLQARLQPEVRDGAGPIEIYCSFVVSLCGRELVLEASCKSDDGGAVSTATIVKEATGLALIGCTLAVRKYLFDESQ
jgi:hypothetical protein